MRGGKRQGAGRPKGARNKKWDKQTTGAKFESAQEYLAAVVEGTEPPDPARIQAAKALLPFEAAKVRAPRKSKTPRQMAQAQALANTDAEREEWRRRSEAVRSAHAARKSKEV